MGEGQARCVSCMTTGETSRFCVFCRLPLLRPVQAKSILSTTRLRRVRSSSQGHTETGTGKEDSDCHALLTCSSLTCCKRAKASARGKEGRQSRTHACTVHTVARRREKERKGREGERDIQK